MWLPVVLMVLLIVTLCVLVNLQAKLKNEAFKHSCQITDMKFAHAIEISKVRKVAVSQSKAVTRGQVSEQLVPILPGFNYNLSDCFFCGNPFDYIIYDGMSEFRDGNKDKEVSIIFADVKFNTANMSPVQNAVKKAITEGRVRFEKFHVDSDNNLNIK